MKQQEARKLLGLENAMPSLTVDIVQEAWRAAVKRNHPDTAPFDDAQGSLQLKLGMLTKAKKMLLDVASGADLACKTCKGRGRVPAQMGWQKCSVCKGSGDKR